MINVKDAPYNATGNGSDDSAAVWSALSALLNQGGGELYFPRGVYNLAAWPPTGTVPATPPALTAPIRLRGEVPGGVVIRGPAAKTQKFALIRDDLSVTGLDFESWQMAFDGAGSGVVNEVSFDECAFRDSAYFLYWSGNAGEFVSRLVIDRCTFEGLTSAVVMGNVNREAIYFTRSSAVDCQRYVLRMLAVVASSGAEPAGPGLVVFSENYVSNLNADLFNPQYAEARVVQVSCERLVVTDNLVKGVRSKVGGANANFTYTSSLYSLIAGNYLEDIGEPGDASGGPMIHEKNSGAREGRYLYNHFVQNPTVTGDPLRSAGIVVMPQGNTVIQGNQARGLHNSLVQAVYNSENLVIANNVVKDENSPYGSICIYGGRNVVIEGNIIDGVRNTYLLGWPYFARGIRLERYSERIPGEPVTYVYHSPRNVRIANNVIHGVSGDSNKGAGVFVYASGADVAMRNLSIADNTITGCVTGIELRADLGSSFGDAEISGNTFRDNGVNVFASPVPASFTTRNNRGYITEASGLATVAAGTTSVAVTHGLSRTPTLAGISATPASPPDSLGAMNYWISNPTPTSFTINVDGAPGADVNYSWTAQVL
jgi:hypothetical protein